MAKLPSEAELLRTVRDFMSGKNEEGESVTRNDLAGISTRKAVHVAMAMILARPDRFLHITGKHCWINGNFQYILTTLLCIGVPNSTLSPASLVGVCRAASLYTSESGRGGYKQVQPTPWDGLSALVEELKNHPAVDAFFAEVDEATRIRDLPKSTAITGGHQSPQVRAEQLLTWLSNQDPDAVQALRTLLNT